MLKNDKWIIKRAQEGMIEPFESSLVRKIESSDKQFRKVLSYGASSYGYDIRYLIHEIFNKQQQQRCNFSL